MDDKANALLDAMAEALAPRVAKILNGAALGKVVYTVSDLAERYGMSKSAMRQRVMAGEFGEVVHFGTNSYGVTGEGVRQYEAAHTGPARPARGGKRPAAHRRHEDPGPI